MYWSHDPRKFDSRPPRGWGLVTTPAGCCETSAIRHSCFCVPADAPELLKLATDGALDLSEAAPGARDGSPLVGLVVATWSAALELYQLAALMTGWQTEIDPFMSDTVRVCIGHDHRRTFARPFPDMLRAL